MHDCPNIQKNEKDQNFLKTLFSSESLPALNI
jgi:hypothetical protein